jgi:hypothetical protein
MRILFIAAASAACIHPAIAADPADPAAPAPRVAYRSVFADTPTGVEEAATPWRDANTEVGRFTRGHIDLLRWEAARQPASPGTAVPRAAPPLPAAPAAPAAAPAHKH